MRVSLKRTAVVQNVSFEKETSRGFSTRNFYPLVLPPSSLVCTLSFSIFCNPFSFNCGTLQTLAKFKIVKTGSDVMDFFCAGRTVVHLVSSLRLIGRENTRPKWIVSMSSLHMYVY